MFRQELAKENLPKIEWLLKIDQKELCLNFVALGLKIFWSVIYISAQMYSYLKVLFLLLNSKEICRSSLCSRDKSPKLDIAGSKKKTLYTIVHVALAHVRRTYSCNNITTTLIQISRLFYFGFFSKTNQQMII